MQANSLKLKAFTLKGRLYTLTVLQLQNADIALFEQQLEEIIAKAPRLFEGTPLVLDCSVIQDTEQDTELDLQCFYTALRSRNLLPVAIQGGTPVLASIAQCMGLAVLHGSSTQDKALLAEMSEEYTQGPVASPDLLVTRLQTMPVRSGQQVVGKGRDLVITAAVSHGAELLSDGNIHVYGTLRGRALAGISGNKNARIFCLSLEAELVSIAGYYLLSDAITVQSGPCQIYLQDDRLVIEPFG